MMNSLREENSDIITPFKFNNETISNYLSILMNIPYSPQRDQKEIDIINNSIEMLLIYKHKTSTTIKDNENIYKLINSINISNLFEISHEKSNRDNSSDFEVEIRTLIDEKGGNSLDIFPEHYQTRVIGYKK